MQHSEQLRLTAAEAEFIQHLRATGADIMHQSLTRMMQLSLVQVSDPAAPPGINAASCERLFFYVTLLEHFQAISLEAKKIE